MLRSFPLLPLIFLAGCASTNPQDPFEPMNRGIYEFNDTLDRHVLKPVAQGYTAVVPAPGRTMVNNFFSNLNDVVVTANDILQLKGSQAVTDFGRLLINSTLGVFGLIDVASASGYPKHREDFGQTLGYWGVSSGPYLMLPLLGPSSLRDGVGSLVDSVPSPVAQSRPVTTRNELYAAQGLNARAMLLDQEKVLDTAVLDRYSFMRDAYLQHRQSLVYDGNPPRPKYDDDELDDPLPEKN